MAGYSNQKVTRCVEGLSRPQRTLCGPSYCLALHVASQDTTCANVGYAQARELPQVVLGGLACYHGRLTRRVSGRILRSNPIHCTSSKLCFLTGVKYWKHLAWTSPSTLPHPVELVQTMRLGQVQGIPQRLGFMLSSATYWESWQTASMLLPAGSMMNAL